MNAVLETTGLGKVHGEGAAAVTALADVDLAVAHGEFVAVTGPSGCGKSTLLNLLGGLDRPTGGEVLVRGERLATAGEARRARLRRSEVGFVFQFFNLIANLTVADNVELPALLAGVPAREARRRAAELLERLGLAETARRVPGDLSGGQQQRVAIARALVNRPAVLLADEPAGNLDTAAAREVVAVLRERHADGQTIILVTHDMRVASAAGRVVAMRDGRIVGESMPDAGEGPDALSRIVSAHAARLGVVSGRDRRCDRAHRCDQRARCARGHAHPAGAGAARGAIGA